MFEVVGALFSMFVQSFFFLSENSQPISLGVSTAKVSQADLQDLRLFFMFEGYFLCLKKQKQLGVRVCEGSDGGEKRMCGFGVSFPLVSRNTDTEFTFG